MCRLIYSVSVHGTGKTVDDTDVVDRGTDGMSSTNKLKNLLTFHVHSYQNVYNRRLINLRSKVKRGVSHPSPF